MCAATRGAEAALPSSMEMECVFQRRRSPSDVTDVASAFAAGSASREEAVLPNEQGAPVPGLTAVTAAGWVPLSLRDGMMCAQGERKPEPRQRASDALDAPAADPVNSCRGHEAAEENAESAPETAWIPLSVRQAQAREKVEEEARARKMAAVVKPVTYDDATGLPCIPTSCLPIKHWSRWREGNGVRAARVKARNDRSRILANRVMKALKMNAAELVYKSYCCELARINEEDKARSAACDVPAPAPVQDGDIPKPMLSRSNSFELLAKAVAADIAALDSAEPATAPLANECDGAPRCTKHVDSAEIVSNGVGEHCAWTGLEEAQDRREVNLNAERGA